MGEGRRCSRHPLRLENGPRHLREPASEPALPDVLRLQRVVQLPCELLAVRAVDRAMDVHDDVAAASRGSDRLPLARPVDRERRGLRRQPAALVEDGGVYVVVVARANPPGNRPLASPSTSAVNHLLGDR